MPNTAVVDRIAQALTSNNLIHPGDKNQPPTAIPIPAFRTAGMAPELADKISATTKLIAEAIVATIEQDHTIIPTQELKQLQTDVTQQAPNNTALHCRNCGTHLAQLDINRLDGRQLITVLGALKPDCPHR